MLALEFKWYKFDTGMYYFINEEIRELVITIVYIDDICFIGSKYSLLLLKLRQKIYDKMGMLWLWKKQRVSWNTYKL